MKYDQFLKDLMDGKVARVYFFHGEENYLIDEGVQKILTKFVKKGSAGFDREIFYGDDVDANRVISAVTAVPMLGGRKVVVVKQFDRMPPTDQEYIARYCMRPSPHSILVLTAKKPDFRKKPFQILRKVAAEVECKPLYASDMKEYLINLVATKGKSIHPQAAQLLVDRLGTSLGSLVNEVNKLLEFTRERREITVEDVAHVVGISRSFNIFELRDAIGERNLKKSLFIARRMIELGEKPVYIVSMLTGYFLELWKIQLLKQQRKTNTQIGRELHIHHFFVNKEIDQAMKFSREEIFRNMKILLEADTHLKTSYQKPGLVVELAIFQMLRKKRKAA